jgi:hypothetical protein
MVNGMLKRRKPRDSSSLSNSAVASASASTTVTPSKTPSGPGSPGQDISDENEEKAKNAEQVDNADAGADDDEYEDMPEPEYLRYEPHTGLDPEKYAVLPNDWPYNVPYGVRHFCVWSRVSDTRVREPCRVLSVSVFFFRTSCESARDRLPPHGCLTPSLCYLVFVLVPFLILVLDPVLILVVVPVRSSSPFSS